MVKIWATTELEQNLRESGRAVIAGADEVGRGALAGPLVVGCVVVGPSFDVAVCDSKMLDRPRREKLAGKIKQQALDFSYGWVSAAEIDECGLAIALRLGYMRAIEGLQLAVSHWLLDGNVNYLADFACAQAEVAGDARHSCIAAASILAKVERDNYMVAQAQHFPDYNFDHNVGYGTPAHRLALAKFGLNDLHRRSFVKL